PYYDAEPLAPLERGVDPVHCSILNVAVTIEEARAINNDKSRKVIRSASGMCEAGRIKHRLKYNLWRPACTVLFVGYQAEETLGRSLDEGAKHVKLFGEEIEVEARVMTLPGTSGHADVNGLLRWISAFEEKPQRVFVCHGE